MASFTVGDGTGSDQAAAAMARAIRGELTPAEQRVRAYYAPPSPEDPETKNSRILLETLKKANTTNEKSDLDNALQSIMYFKEKYYCSQSSKFRGKNAKKLTELEKIIEDKMEDFEFAHPCQEIWSSQLSNWRYSSDSDSSSDEGAGAGAGASKEGGRRRRRKSKKRKKKKKKKTRRKRKKRKTRKKRKLRKKKRRKTNRK